MRAFCTQRKNEPGIKAFGAWGHLSSWDEFMCLSVREYLCGDCCIYIYSCSVSSLRGSYACMNSGCKEYIRTDSTMYMCIDTIHGSFNAKSINSELGDASTY